MAQKLSVLGLDIAKTAVLESHAMLDRHTYLHPVFFPLRTLS
jgi:hypothetical protein